MSINRKCCNPSFDFHKKARTGKHKRQTPKQRRVLVGMTVTAWKRAGRPTADLSSRLEGVS